MGYRGGPARRSVLYAAAERKRIETIPDLDSVDDQLYVFTGENGSVGIPNAVRCPLSFSLLLLLLLQLLLLVCCLTACDPLPPALLLLSWWLAQLLQQQLLLLLLLQQLRLLQDAARCFCADVPPFGQLRRRERQKNPAARNHKLLL